MQLMCQSLVSTPTYKKLFRTRPVIRYLLGIFPPIKALAYFGFLLWVDLEPISQPFSSSSSSFLDLKLIATVLNWPGCFVYYSVFLTLLL